MTNFEWITSMNEDEFAEYIYSVYLTGKYDEAHRGLNMGRADSTYYVDYNKWLQETHKA